MKNERILNALSKADDRYVEEAAPVKAGSGNALAGDTVQPASVTVAAKRRSFGGRAAAAAGLCAVVGGLTLWGALGTGNRISEGAASQSIDPSTVVDLTQGNISGQSTVFLSREELYTNMWTMFIPRRLPENYQLAENTRFDTAGFSNEGTIYIKLTNGSNPISYTVYAGSRKYDDLGGSELLMREMSLEDMPLLKENGWIDCGNFTIMIKVDIEKPDLISDEELYRFIMSAPFAGKFADSGIDSIDLSEYIHTYLPTVAFDEYYDIERYTISGELTDSVLAFDGTCAYFNKQTSGAAKLTSIGWYNVKTGETGYLPDKDGAAAILGYIYSDGKYVYCEKTVYEELSSSIVRFDIESGEEETVIDVGTEGILSDVTVCGGRLFFRVDFFREDGEKLACYDMTSGVTGTVAASASSLPDPAFAYTYSDVDIFTMLPYKDGIIYGAKLEEYTVQGEVLQFCDLFYWDGESVTVPLFRARPESIMKSETGEQICFSDGKIVYLVMETNISGTNAADGVQDTLCAFDLTDAFSGFDSVMEQVLADNMNPSGSPYHEWHGSTAGCGGGMVAIDPYSGLIYDGENGWFTGVNMNIYYKAVKSCFDGMAMLEFADVEYDANLDFVNYPEGGKDLTLCIITRK